MAKSEYLQREEAAKKQLGAKGVKKRVKQLPTAARASLREMTGIDVSRKGVSVDPIGLAMAVSPFKLLKASKALRAAGQVGKAAAVEARLGAKTIGRNIPKDYSYFPKGLASGPGTVEGKLRSASTSVFPRASKATPASPRLQKVADTITKRHYADVAKKGIGHGDAVNMPRAQVLRNLKAKRGIQINKPR